MDADRRGARRIEVAGPAGSGKTTLIESLATRLPVRFGVTACNRSCIPLALRLLPVLPAGYLVSELRHGRFPPETLRSMVYLELWIRESANRWKEEPAHVLFDHGPFYRLAAIEEFGPPASAGLRRWWESMRNAWSATMSLVIWLDAPDSMLLERIRSRDRAHPCKEMSDGDASAWLGRYRAGFESSLAVLQLSRPADLVRIDTSRQRPDEIAASLVDLIETHDG